MHCSAGVLFMMLSHISRQGTGSWCLRCQSCCGCMALGRHSDLHDLAVEQEISRLLW